MKTLIQEIKDNRDNLPFAFQLLEMKKKSMKNERVKYVRNNKNNDTVEMVTSHYKLIIRLL